MSATTSDAAPLKGHHVIMVSQPEAVTNVIMQAAGAVAQVPVGA